MLQTPGREYAGLRETQVGKGNEMNVGLDKRGEKGGGSQRGFGKVDRGA